MCSQIIQSQEPWSAIQMQDTQHCICDICNLLPDLIRRQADIIFIQYPFSYKSSIWLCPCMGCLWSQVATYMHSVYSQHVHPCNWHSMCDPSYTIMILILVEVCKYSPIEGCLYFDPIRSSSWMLGTHEPRQISSVGGRHRDRTIADIYRSCS